ncbi:MAG TPA: hypothetical protein VG839_02350 [Asticcacaulis sp.]|nr:hypothetical protein [Asticcacaulis sp.]
MWGMFGKIAAGLVCLLLLWTAVTSVVTGSDAAIYDAQGSDIVGTKEFVSQDVIRRSEAYTDMMRRQDLDALRLQTDPSILNDDFYKAVPVIAHYASADKPKAIRVLGYSVSKVLSTSGQWTDTLVTIGHYYDWGVIITIIRIHEQNHVSKVIAYNLHRLTNADITQVKFSLIDKPLINYAMLALAGAILIFSVITLYVAFTRPRLKLRWLWVVVTALGVGHFTFNWGTAQIALDFMSLYIPQASLTQEIAQYPMLNFWLPVGGVLFWFLARYKPAPVPVGHPEG